MTDTRWKARERQTARLLGTERLPSNGRAQPDMVTPSGWSIEHKSVENVPLWLLRAVDQAARDAPPGARPATVLVCQPAPGWPLRRLVVMDFAAFAELAGADARTQPPAAAEPSAALPERRSPAGGLFIGGKLPRRDRGRLC